ncbi:potassium channel family protein [Candidatus Woesearchaeota archaeon]|nr:potassium channel family protein [Candidatus Woesearchaeota archaeon]
MIDEKLVHPFIVVVLFILIGVFFYHYAEGWTYSDSFYFTAMTITTVGYGDLVPTTTHSKLFTAFYAMFGITLMLYIISDIVMVFLAEDKVIRKAVSAMRRLSHHEKTLGSHERAIKKLKKEVKTKVTKKKNK